nr:MAG TPA: archeaosine synthase [Caudoviricetes sp.]
MHFKLYLSFEDKNLPPTELMETLVMRLKSHCAPIRN